MTIESIRLRILKYKIKLRAKKRNKKLVNKSFTIISNNCWGGMLYESFNLQKQSPTIGLFFMADEYINFLKKFPDILKSPISFIKPEQSKYYEYLKKDKHFGTYPIGVIDGVEIEFLHYKNEDEVLNKWVRRCKRINYDKLIFKMNDQNNCTYSHLKCFSEMPFKNKIIFSSNKSNFECLTYSIKSKKNYILTSKEPIFDNRKLKITNLINQL